MTSSPSHPLMLCYDGSPHAKYAIAYAARMFPHGHALVVTVWQPTAALGSLAWSGALERMDTFSEMDRTVAENAMRLSAEGAEIARRAGLVAEPLLVEAVGPVWKTLVDVADRRDAVMIVMGSRGRATLASVLLGSVSNAVVHHADQPTLVVHDREASEGTAAWRAAA